MPIHDDMIRSPSVPNAVRVSLHRRVGLAALVTAMSAAAAACSRADDTPTVCPSDLRFVTTPTTRTVRSGESFVAQAQAFGCAGTKLLDEIFVWRSDDSTIARVDSVSGLITGRSPGSTLVRAFGRRYGANSLPVQTTVTP